MIRLNAKFMHTPWFVDRDGDFQRWNIDLCGERCKATTRTVDELKSAGMDPTVQLNVYAFRQSTRFPTISQRRSK